MIDIDDAKMKLESQNQNFGKVTREKRCDARGKFKKRAGSLSLLACISLFSFHKQYTEGGTYLLRFFQLMEDFITYLN